MSPLMVLSLQIPPPKVHKAACLLGRHPGRVDRELTCVHASHEDANSLRLWFKHQQPEPSIIIIDITSSRLVGDRENVPPSRRPQ